MKDETWRSMLASNRRGFISVPFHWVFVILAGGFVLLLFFFLIQSGQEIAQTSSSTALLRHMEVLLTGISSLDTSAVTIPSRETVELSFSCETLGDVTDSDVRISGVATNQEIDHLLLFSPAKIAGELILTHTMNITMPFYIGQAIYVTDEDTAFVFLNFAQEQELRQLLHPNATVLSVNDLSEIGRFDRYVIMTDADVNSFVFPERIARADTRVYDGSNMYTISYANGRAQQVMWNVDVHSDAFLVGLLYAKDANYYNCVEKKVFDQYLRVYDLLQKRTEKITEKITSSSISMPPTCTSVYTAFKTGELPTDLQTASNQASVLSADNRALERYSCPEIY